MTDCKKFTIFINVKIKLKTKKDHQTTIKKIKKY